MLSKFMPHQIGLRDSKYFCVGSTTKQILIVILGMTICSLVKVHIDSLKTNKFRLEI